MKLLMITSLKEYLPDISSLLQQAKIEVFSVSKTTGIRNNGQADMLEAWFGNRPGEYDSIFLFSFTGDAEASGALDLIREYNNGHHTGFPVRAFTLAVGDYVHAEI